MARILAPALVELLMLKRSKGKYQYLGGGEVLQSADMRTLLDYIQELERALASAAYLEDAIRKMASEVRPPMILIQPMPPEEPEGA